MFLRRTKEGQMVILIVYIDDIILKGNDLEGMKLLKELTKEFELKELGALKYFSSMEVAWSRKGIVVSQQKYILDLLKDSGMLGCKPVETLVTHKVKCIVAFAVSLVSQFMHSPRKQPVGFSTTLKDKGCSLIRET